MRRFYQTKQDLKNERDIMASVGTEGSTYEWLSQPRKDTPVDVINTLSDGRMYAIEIKDRYGFTASFFFDHGGVYLSCRKVERALELKDEIGAKAALFLVRTKDKRVFCIDMLDIDDVSGQEWFKRKAGSEHRNDVEELVWKIPLGDFKELDPK
jgi:hypothetical protein